MPPKKKKNENLPPLQGTVVKPFLFYADVWQRNQLDSSRMAAYKQMETEGQIQILKVTYSKADQMVVIEYKSAMPHEWVIDDLKNRLPKIVPEQMSIV